MPKRKKLLPGPKPSITLEVVKRVSERVAHGLTLALALAAEDNAKVNEETWKKALQAHPEFSPHYEAGKGKFLEHAVTRLANADDLKYLCWLLERRHSDLFARPVAADITVNATATASASAGIPEDVLDRARDIARAETVPIKQQHVPAE